MSFEFTNSYAELPDTFYTKQQPALRLEKPELFFVNEALAEELGSNATYVNSHEALGIFTGQSLPLDTDPLAMVYAGHQFGGWSPQLGDGRALLLGEVTGNSGQRFDVQLKGSGRTPYSRGGDGKSALGPVIREYLVSEAMHKLGVPTTRALAAVRSGEMVLRETGPLPGGIFTRVASSHVRVGTFQYFAASGDVSSLRTLTSYVIDRHYPDAKTAENPIADFLKQVIARQAKLISLWLKFGFVHGVMNTDNMQIAGETIDFGPCAFMDIFESDKVFSSIDQNGRYAWGRQPQLAHWNLVRLAEAMLPIWYPKGSEDQEAASKEAQAVLAEFGEVFNGHFVAAFSQKLGLKEDVPENRDLIEDTLGMMAEQKLDFTQFFANLRRSDDAEYNSSFLDAFSKRQVGENWLKRLADLRSVQRISDDAAAQAMAMANPIYIPRNHRVEAAIQAGIKYDYEPMKQLHAVLQNPFEQQDEMDQFEWAPEPDEVVLQTFCGT